MPSLSSMRALDSAGDAVQPLGPPIRKEAVVPAPVPAPTGTPGIVRLPDGKLATDLPDPTKAHASICFDFEGDFKRSLAASPEVFQQEFMADLSAVEQRVVAFYGGAIGKLVADAFGTTTGRISSSIPHFTEAERLPKIRGRVHDSIVFDDLGDKGPR